MEARQEVSELESEPAPSLPAPTSTQGRAATSWRGALVVRSKDTAQPWASRVPNLLGHTLFALEVLLQAPFAWLIAIFLFGS